LDEALVKTIFREAFSRWGDVININIHLGEAAASPNFWIGWFRHQHEINGIPCQSFDGHGGDIAHAFPPAPCSPRLAGECHFDRDESWEATHGPLVLNLYTVALHEIGHLLGLAAHSETRGDVMYGHYKGMGRQLSRNDVAAMRRLYGLGPR